MLRTAQSRLQEKERRMSLFHTMSLRFQGDLKDYDKILRILKTTENLLQTTPMSMSRRLMQPNLF